MAESKATTSNYTVLARRYRPTRFEDFVGQEAVVKALCSAIEQNRVAHAYLFTGARGVGKTSMARMFARALNCVKGPTTNPCGVCDQCVAISAGQDVDVLEIDGASNNKVDEIRELRQAVAYRPSRSRFKIYIIDEVHMVTPAAFNALLKTLEEPPAHVKFIFATTEVQKIPITILSRCQRYDFGGISVEKIHAKLKEIAVAEGVMVEEEALEIVARRAGGSMRDSQSLLDQLFAYCGKKITADDAHRALGTANEQRVRELSSALLACDAATALSIVDAGAAEAVQLGEWVEQMLDYFRDLMVLSVDPKATLVSMPNRLRNEMLEEIKNRGSERILEFMDILSACRMRMKSSPFARTILEMTVVRLCKLDQFIGIERAIASGPQTPLPAPVRSKIESKPAAVPSTAVPSAAVPSTAAPSAGAQSVVVEPAKPTPAKPAPEKKSPYANGHVEKEEESAVQESAILNEPVTAENWRFFWRHFLDQLRTTEAFLTAMLQDCEKVECIEPNQLEIYISAASYGSCKSYAEHARSAWESASRKIAGRIVVLNVRKGESQAAAPVLENTAELRALAMKDPLVLHAEQKLGAKLIAVDRVEVPKTNVEESDE